MLHMAFEKFASRSFLAATHVVREAAHETLSRIWPKRVSRTQGKAYPSRAASYSRALRHREMSNRHSSFVAC